MSKAEEILKKEGISNFHKDIRNMKKRDIQKHFCFKTKRRINSTKLIKNLIWQGYCQIVSGEAPPVEGNLRSFWYSNVKPVLSRVGFDVGDQKYYDKLSHIFVELITDHRLFRYIDFGFFDSRQHCRTIGKDNGNLILFIEKEGLYFNAKVIAKKYGATAIGFQGFPNHITTEFFIRDMISAGLLKDPVHLFGVVDYDPSGYWILKEFEKQLLGYGVEIASCDSLVKLKLIPDIEYNKYKLGKGRRIKNWLEITGGIAGEAYGVEANALRSAGIREIFDSSIQPYLSTSSRQAKTQPKAMSKTKVDWLAWLGN